MAGPDSELGSIPDVMPSSAGPKDAKLRSLKKEDRFSLLQLCTRGAAEHLLGADDTHNSKI